MESRGTAADEDIVGALVALGVDSGAAADYVRRGDAEGAVFDAVLLPERLERTVSAEDVAERGGLSISDIGELMEAFGLPRPRAGEPVFTPAEATALVELGRLGELWPADVRVPIGRVYGGMLSGIARAEVQAFQTHTQQQVAGGHDDPAHLAALKVVIQRLLPLADPLLLGVHRRWIEHELGQRAVVAAEQRAGGTALPGAMDATIMFCDLKDFTAFAEAKGDALAIAAIDRFFDAVERERGEGEFVKSLGDGALLVYRDPCEAVEAGMRIIAAMGTNGPPPVHASVHRGIVMARAGDYLGGAVNLAARLLALAGPGELVATAPVVDACGAAFAWAPGGEAELRGVASPVTVHRLARA